MLKKLVARLAKLVPCMAKWIVRPAIMVTRPAKPVGRPAKLVTLICENNCLFYYIEKYIFYLDDYSLFDNRI